MFPTESHVTAPAPDPRVRDGYGLPFSPELHLAAIRAALHEHERYLSSLVVTHVEPVWKDRPAGCKVCPEYVV